MGHKEERIKVTQIWQWMLENTWWRRDLC